MSPARPVGPETVAGAVVPNKSSQRRVASVGMFRQRPTGTGKAAGPGTRPGMSWSARLAILVPRMAIMSSNTFSWRSNFLADICSMVKRFTIETAFEMTIAPRTSSCGLPPNHLVSGSATPLHGRTRSSSVTRASAHLQQSSRSRVRTLGGGGNRTRVLQLRSRPSPSAAGIRLSGAALLPAAVPPRNRRMCPQCSVGVTH